MVRFLISQLLSQMSMRKRSNMDKGEIIIYQTEDGTSSLEVKLQEDTVWLTHQQISLLFDRERSVITKHINNIFKSKELDEKTNVQKMHIPNSDKLVKFYNLDVILSVGYRVNSKRGTQFRIWANNILKEYLVKGYALNEKRLQEQLQRFESLKQSIRLIEDVTRHKVLSITESEGLLRVIADFTYSLDILDQYDYQKLQIIDTSHKDVIPVSYKEAMMAI